MIQVNAMSVSTLTHLFGRDMKQRRRGRILIVSSICGAVDGIATVAVYSATKAFENSFGIALGKELEPYGVGVTCLLPGAVRGTEFRSRSKSQEALCWKLPFYAKTASSVAESGIRAVLRGDSEVTPGLLNRIFLKGLKPVVPQRLHNLMAEIMWNPLSLPFRHKERTAPVVVETNQLTDDKAHVSVVERTRSTIVRPASFSPSTLPRRLVLAEDASPTEVTAENGSVNETAGTAVDDTNRTVPDLSLGENVPVPDCGNSDAIHTSDNVDGSNEQGSGGTQASQSTKPDSQSPTEIELLLEQYKRSRPFSLDPFNERPYFRDPLSFRSGSFMQEGRQHK
jgi:short chain dehydrogenase